MCLYRTEHNSSKDMKYNERKVVAILGQQYIACQHANGQFCRINAPFQPLMNPPWCIIDLHAQNDQAVREQCSLSMSHVPHTFLPVAVTSNLWIIPSNSMTLGSTIAIICPNKATSTIPLQQSLHILRLSLPAVLHPDTFTYPHIIRITV